MRNKIIAVNALIVAIVGLLSFLLVRTTLNSANTNQDRLTLEIQGDVQGAAARLQMDSLGAERWLSAKALAPSLLDVLKAGVGRDRGEARSNDATRRSDDVLKDTQSAKLFSGNPPNFAALVDEQGKILGRNGSSTQRGEDLTESLSGLKSAIASGKSGTDIWVDKDNLYLTSYVGVHDEAGKAIGAVILGRPLSDALARESDQGMPLALLVARGDNLDAVARSSGKGARGGGEDVGGALDDALKGSAKDNAKATLKDQGVNVIREGNVIIGIAPLPEIGVDGRRAVLATAGPAVLLDDVSKVSLPILGMTGLGIILVIVGGWLLGNYITRPINTLEEGLLAILNGQADRRFELDHAELGGLGFRIDQLLNQLMGVEEDTTDAEGRESKSPSAKHFTDAMSVDDKRMEGEGTLDPDAVQHLANEPTADYYARIYREYIAAKKGLGEATDHISEEAFTTRIRGMEKEASDKYGRPVRYQVQARSKEVVLLAIPLP